MGTYQIKDYHTRKLLAFAITDVNEFCNKHPKYLPHHRKGGTWFVIKK